MPLQNSKAYWESREKNKLENSLKDVNKLEKLLEKEYKKAMKNIEKEIRLLYEKYGKDNNLSFYEVNKKLMSNQYKEWRMDLKEYVKLIEATGDEELLLELNTLSIRSRISRLEETLYRCDKYINEIYKTNLEGTTKLLTNTLANSYYQTLYDTHKILGVGPSFAFIDDKFVREVLSFPWSGTDYSKRIWSNRSQLKKVLHSEITQMIVRGEASSKVAKRVSEKMNTSLFNARRLIHTEHSYVMSEGTCKAFKELGIEKYEFLATLDSRTSEVCRSLDGKVFNLKDRVVGVNASPLHCFCRSCELPYFDEKDITTRFARGKNNESIEVPSDMKYSEWEKIFVENKK